MSKKIESGIEVESTKRMVEGERLIYIRWKEINLPKGIISYIFLVGLII